MSKSTKPAPSKKSHKQPDWFTALSPETQKWTLDYLRCLAGNLRQAIKSADTNAEMENDPSGTTGLWTLYTVISAQATETLRHVASFLAELQPPKIVKRPAETVAF